MRACVWGDTQVLGKQWNRDSRLVVDYCVHDSVMKLWPMSRALETNNDDEIVLVELAQVTEQ